MKQQITLVRSSRQVTEAPELSADQSAVVRRPTGSGPVLVLGGPGTGKTTVVVESVVHRVLNGSLEQDRVLVLAPTRLSAASLRDQITARLDRSLSAAPARSWASYAFDLIRRARAAGLLPHVVRPPKLLSGAEQDLIIKELLDGHGSHGVPELPWPQDLHAAIGTRGFRQEMRQLFDRMSEYGLDATNLADYGKQIGRPDWEAAAALYGEYRDVLDIRMPEAFDPAGVITTAVDLLTSEPEFLHSERDSIGFICVDDLQEANPAIHQLLSLIGHGTDVLMTACPDTAVQGFRGARPDLLGELHAGFDHQVETALLTTSHRLGPALAAAWQRVASRISTTGVTPAYRALSARPDQKATSEVHIVDSDLHELRYVSQRILQAEVLDGLDPSDIAVIVRSGRQVSALQRYLISQGIDVHVPSAEKAVRDEAAVRPLLELFGIVLDERLLTPETAVSLLTSRIGGATALELRRLRQVLRREELSAGGGRGSDELLVEALQRPAQLELLGWEGWAGLRIARMLEAGAKAMETSGANAETLLWAIWDASRLSAHWAEVSLGAGSAAMRADRDLDAMMALFHAAERYVDQLPGSTPAQFLEYLTNQELPMDTLAARALGRKAVEILTPASAAGRQWPMVIVAGIQEGTWPDLRLRGELLGSGELAALMEHGKNYKASRHPLALMQATRFDELRSFSTAVSRASTRLICTAVSSEEEQPSQFLDLIDPLPDDADSRKTTAVLRPLSVRGLVADYRRIAQEEQPDSAQAVRQLARMARHRPVVPGALPNQWWGLQPLSSAEAIVPAGQPVYVSPSKVEAVLKSPLDWFVSAAGGEAARDFARSLGTLVHEIAQDLPEATGSEYVAELQRRWPKLGMKENWEGQMDFLRAEKMVRKLAGYVIRMRQEGRELLAVESDFSTALPAVREDLAGTILRGQVDRIEVDSRGQLHIVDLKTGKNAPSKDDLEGHPQLASYQVAANAGAFEDVQGAAGSGSGGASLVQLGTTLKDAGVQGQAALNPEESWARDMVLEAAKLMSGESFDSIHAPGRQTFGGHGCRLPEICPLCPEGKQVTQ